jgi:hypothetical protein
MCVIKQIEVPNVEARFFHDVCECHPEPVEMVELRGSDTQSSVVYRIDKIKKLPGHWAAIRTRYAEWKAPKAKRKAPLLLTHRRDAPLPSPTQSPKTSRRKEQSRSRAR